MKKKILITYASYGSGHKTMAEYVYEHLKRNFKYEVKLVDLTPYMSPVSKGSITAFNFIYNHQLKKLFSFLYKGSNNKLMNSNYRFLFKNFVFNETMQEVYTSFNPDIVFSTHFMGSNVAGILKEKGLINAKIVTLVTDYKFHRLWLSSKDKDEVLLVANEIVKKEVLKSNPYTKNIHVTGLPCDVKKVEDLISKQEIYNKYGLSPKNDYILFFGGGSKGTSAYYKYLKKLLKKDLKSHILFVCGKSKNTFNKVRKLEDKYSNLHTFGFVNNVYELMEISSLVITKPGGALVTECLEMQKYMLLLPGMGGQESYNARYVSQNNYGVITKNCHRLIKELQKYERNKGKYLGKLKKDKKNTACLKNIESIIRKL